MNKNKISISKTLQKKENNTPITLNPNTLPEGQKLFYLMARRICEKEQRPFSFGDFHNMSKSNFRQFIHKIRPLLEVVYNSHPAFYKIKGIDLPGDSHRITLDHKVPGEDFYHILNTLQFKEPYIHDITIRVQDSSLHKRLLSFGNTVDRSNNSIKVNVPQFDNNITIKVIVYSETIMIHLGCTYRPLIYNTSTIWHLHEVLANVSFWLTRLSNDIILPLVKDWICTHYHMNKDGSQSFNGKSFNFTLEDVSSGMIRFYSKKMKDGKVIPRLEQIQTPDRTLADEMKHAMFIRSSEYVGE